MQPLPVMRLRIARAVRQYGRRMLGLMLLVALCVSVLSLAGKQPEQRSNRQFNNYGHVIKEKIHTSNVHMEDINTMLLDLLAFQPNAAVTDDSVMFDNIAVSGLTPLTMDALEEAMLMPPQLLTELAHRNTQVVKYLSNPKLPMPTYKKNGAVIVGGVKDDATWSALLTVRIFRKMGGTLPIEVMLPTVDDYLRDKQICEKYLKDLNAQCYVLEERIGMKRDTLQGAHFMWMFDAVKTELAILTSRFQNVLYLKPNVLLLHAVKDSIFTSKMFKDSGMVFWNNHDRRYASPSFYSMAGIEVDAKATSSKGFPLPAARAKTRDDEFHDLEGTLPYRQTSDAVVLVNKATHLKAVLLSLFYNLNGKDMYHPLLSVAPELDPPANSALIAAAHVLKLPYFQTHVDIETTGFQYINNFHRIGNVHFDPAADLQSVHRFISKATDPTTLTWDAFQTFVETVKHGKTPQFLELTHLELKPMELFDKNIMFKNNGDRIKIFTSEFIKPSFELEMWKIMKDYICNYEVHCAYLDRHFSSLTSRRQFCTSKMQNHIMWLQSH